ncbi:CapA family protein [Candidatus Saccharibacteria bacterium]|nr:CapA family protein [Candidatus Saccharibacteria bacterium]
MKYIHGVKVRSWRLFGRFWWCLMIGAMLMGGLFYSLNRSWLGIGQTVWDTQTILVTDSLVERNIEYSASVVFLGDTMLGRVVGPAILGGEDPFEKMRPILDTYDLKVANIESVIADPAVATTPASKRYTFNAPLAVLDSLKSVPIDVNVLANNHTGDFGRLAMLDMLQNFDNAGLTHVGLGADIDTAFQPLLMDLKLQPIGVDDAPDVSAKLAIIAFNDFENSFSDAGVGLPGSAFFDKTKLQASIDNARSEGADFVFVVPHWGTEFVLNQHNTRQQELGHWLIDAGADAVIGGHPHVIQPTEVYNGKLIVYSLGNFVFSGMESIANTGRGQMVGLTIGTKIAYREDEIVQSGDLEMSEPAYHFYNLDMAGYPIPE